MRFASCKLAIAYDRFYGRIVQTTRYDWQLKWHPLLCNSSVNIIQFLHFNFWHRPMHKWQAATVQSTNAYEAYLVFVYQINTCRLVTIAYVCPSRLLSPDTSCWSPFCIKLVTSAVFVLCDFHKRIKIYTHRRRRKKDRRRNVEIKEVLEWEPLSLVIKKYIKMVLIKVRMMPIGRNAVWWWRLTEQHRARQRNCVNEDMKILGLSQEPGMQSFNKWRKKIKGHSANPGLPENWPL